MNRYRRYTLALLLTLVLASPLASESVDWSKPETIDPYEKGVGDFLDTDVNELARKAHEAYQSGKYEESARYHLALLRLDITNGGNIYNLACCYGLLDRDSLAAEYLLRAFKTGFDNIEHAKRDPDFEKVRGKPVFDSAIDSLAQIVEKKRKASGRVVRVEAPALFKCHVQVPADYDSIKTYPLLVGLHGLGSSPERFIGLWQRFEDPQFICASPQAPYPYPTGGDLGYTWHLWEAGHSATRMSAEYIVRVVESLREDYKIGDVYLFGFSQGCAHAYITGVKYHDLFKGLICFGGWLDDDYLLEEMLEAANNLRVFIAHSPEDRSVVYESGTKARDILQRLGFDVTFHEFEGGHRVPQEPLRKAQKWMFNGTAGR
jgi:predicted esterase